MILSFAFSSCNELMDPLNDNHSTFNRVYNDPAFAEGLLITAYTKIPTNGLTYNDVATDDAVSNVKTNSYLRMANGQWSALSNPVNQWDNCNSAILYLNQFLSIVDTVTWKWSSAEINTLMKQRFTGEAYALRGLF
ncbi:MAG: RagB/SusD family nutrient uptake outer membrane protein, partial [Bacteroidota bacterium]|nr:RagB/SusD family nutrient uptake outer membrane protein [Bacteroidota bacterium]